MHRILKKKNPYSIYIYIYIWVNLYSLFFLLKMKQYRFWMFSGNNLFSNELSKAIVVTAPKKKKNRILCVFPPFDLK